MADSCVLVLVMKEPRLMLEAGGSARAAEFRMMAAREAESKRMAESTAGKVEGIGSKYAPACLDLAGRASHNFTVSAISWLLRKWNSRGAGSWMTVCSPRWLRRRKHPPRLKALCATPW